MAENLINTLFGLEVYNSAPRCRNEDCDNPADNAGNGKWHLLCSMHHRAKYQHKNGNTSYKGHKKDFCENVDGRLNFKCTSTILIKAQLEVDHIDGDKTNDNPTNFQTLCCCCHRYKTNVNGDRGPLEKRKYYLENLKKALEEHSSIA
jgi:hypothetical protein